MCYAKCFIGVLVLVVLGCGKVEKKALLKEESMTIDKKTFGYIDDVAIQIFTLSGPDGSQISITNFGGIIQSWVVPDHTGKLLDIVLGFDDLVSYQQEHPYFGAIIGRYANRIAQGKFEIADIEYILATNDGANHLHGGVRGFDKQIWQVTNHGIEDGRATLTMHHVSPDGSEGYPGELDVEVTYSYNMDGQLRIAYQAKTTKPTFVNLTNHTYFNLGGHNSKDITDHVLQMSASRYTPVDASLIPTGEIRNVEGSAMDFREPQPIGLRIDDKDVQLGYGGGYDHNFVLDQQSLDSEAAVVYDPVSKIHLSTYTTEPGIQLYTGNFLDGSIRGKGGVFYEKRSGLSLETQHYPDSPNQPAFPSTLLRPGDTYESTTIYHVRSSK